MLVLRVSKSSPRGTEAKFLSPDWGIKSILVWGQGRLWHIGLPMRAVYMLELEEAYAFDVVFIWVHIPAAQREKN